MERFVYARYERADDTRAFLQSLEGIRFAQSRSFIETKGRHWSGTYKWYRQENNYFTLVYESDGEQEVESFQFFHTEGDIVALPIKKIDEEQGVVEFYIGPSVTAFTVYDEELLPNDSTIGRFKVEVLDTLNFSLIGTYNSYDLPEDIEVKIPDALITKVNKHLAFLFPNSDSKYDKQRLEMDIVNGYKTGLKTESLDVNGEKITIQLSRRLQHKIPLAATIRQVINNTYKVIDIDSVKINGYMKRYVLIPDKAAMLRELAEIATPEEWTIKRENDVLDRYLNAQFFLAHIMDDIRTNEWKYVKDKAWPYKHQIPTMAVFDTGLTNRRREQVFCVLRITGEDESIKEYVFQGFAVYGQGALGKKMMRDLGVAPSHGIYYEWEKDLWFSYHSRHIVCDFHHMVYDNLSRFSEEFIRKYTSVEDPRIKTIPFKGMLVQYLKSHEYLLSTLEDKLKHAVEDARTRCLYDYKIPVFIRDMKMYRPQLLLPLYLLNEEKPDMALVIERMPNGDYQGHTVITLDMAYKDARVFNRLDYGWLTMDAVKSAMKR